MKCLVCKNDELQASFTTYFSDIGSCYVIIENVPCRKCKQCGEEFFTASVMKKIDEILAKLKNVSSKIFIVSYKEAA